MTYPHAPITEAIIDIRTVPRAGLQPEALAAVGSSVAARYPHKNETFRFATQLTVAVQGKEPPRQAAEHVPIGYQFLANDRVFSAHLDGWTFNKLAPYDRWETFEEEAQELWRLYRNIASPQQIARVAVRYVNRLDLPLPINDFGDYLRTVPEIGPDLPQSLSNFFMQIQIPFDELKSLLILNQALTPSGKENTVSIILDLDLFRAVEVPQDEEAIWKLFSELRIAKNRAFEACITDATRELFR